MSSIKEKIENIIKNKLSGEHETIFYYGRIVDKQKGHRINLDTLNPVLFSALPPFYKFKRYTNEALYKTAMAKLKTFTRSSDSIDVYYDGSSSNTPTLIPVVSLYLYLPKKNCDIMIISYSTSSDRKNNKNVLETIEREIVEFKSPQFTVQCIKANVFKSIVYEVSVKLCDLSSINQLIFGLFEDTHCKKVVEEENNF